MATAHEAEARGGGSFDRFFIRAVISLLSLIAGLVVGFLLAARYVPKSVDATTPIAGASAEPASAEPTSAKPASEAGEPASEAGEPTSEAGEAAPAEAGEAPPLEVADEAGESGEAAVDPEVELEPEPALAPPPPMSGKIIVEVRDLNGEGRDKGEVRDVGLRGGPEVEACVSRHSEALAVVRVHFQVAVDPSGAVTNRVLLQGVNPELDACVGEALDRWSFGAAESNSIFKFKLIWTA